MATIPVTIIGCGHGGQALAADLSRRGCDVSLYAHPKHPGGIRAIAEQGGIHCKGIINEFVPLANITTHLQKAIKKSQYIFISLPSYTHEAMFTELLAYIQPGQTIVTLAANFASLILLKLLASKKINGVNIIDMASLPYVCRSDNNGTVEIVAVKSKLGVASVPSSDILKHIHALTPLFSSQLIAYRDVLSLGMNLTNGIVHPVVALLNAGRINQEKAAFYFYRDGITPEIAALVESLDQERMRVGKALDLEMYSFLELHAQYYGTLYDSIYDFYRLSPAHAAILSPTSLQQRYITEDVAGSLVSWYELGKLAQIDSTVMGSLIQIAGFLNNTNYLHTGTNLARLNLQDRTLEEVKQYVSLGNMSHLSNTETSSTRHSTAFHYAGGLT